MVLLNTFTKISIFSKAGKSGTFATVILENINALCQRGDITISKLRYIMDDNKCFIWCNNDKTYTDT